jgi:hypothetical protein
MNTDGRTVSVYTIQTIILSPYFHHLSRSHVHIQKAACPTVYYSLMKLMCVVMQALCMELV